MKSRTTPDSKQKSKPTDRGDDPTDGSETGATEVAPVSSGRTWQRVDPQPALGSTVNQKLLVADVNDPAVRAFFKWPTAGSDHTSPYSIGIERVYYELARPLSVPVCDTHLEEFNGDHGLVSIRAPGAKPWEIVEQDIIDSRAKFVDSETWPIALALDVAMGNTDRHAGNIFVQWDPPQSRPRVGEECATWFIDFGHCCLWPPWKFGTGRGRSDLVNLDAAADLTIDTINHFRGRLPAKIRQSFPLKGSLERAELVELLRGIPRDSVEKAVSNVPVHYFSPEAADLSTRWIDGRLRRIDTLLDSVFPS